MSAVAEPKPYDRVFDAQKHYRTLLQCTARPGTIGQLDDALIEVPPQLNRASALLALTLLSADCTFHVTEETPAAEQFLRGETMARPAAAEEVDFLFVTDAGRTEEVDRAKPGILAYPEQGATVVVQVNALSPAPMPNALRLALSGPGIESEAVVFVLGAPERLFEILRDRNAEFPLGVDAYLTCDSLSAGPCVLGLPRTTRIAWERV